MGTRKKKRPEFELPPILVDAVQEYLGPGATNKLTANQAVEIVEICTRTAGEIGHAVAGDDTP